MSGWVEKELRSNFARATRAGHRAANTEPRAIRVRYRAREDALRIELANGATITLPVKLIPSLNRALGLKMSARSRSLVEVVACTGKASISI